MQYFPSHSSLLVLFIMLSCGAGQSPASEQTSEITDEFRKYWYAGDAEITSYQLEEARYGEIHQGHAVLIYVTEDFSKSKQVKLDYPDRNPKDKVPILKLNLTKKFNTGVYPYSLMQSIFTPVDQQQYPRSLKVSSSSQEWCGHTFTQLNLEGKQYRMTGLSYFESEGDVEQEIPTALLEDEIWNMIRLAPNDLPKGDIKIIPGTLHARLSHVPMQVEAATATLETSGELMSYTIKYKSNDRSLRINFGKSFPHEIDSWEETKYSGYGPGRKKLTSKATRHKQLKLDYWNRHDVRDLPLRAELGLD